jgi:hypothetical protein
MPRNGDRQLDHIVTTSTSALGRVNMNAVLSELRRTEPSAINSRSNPRVMDRSAEGQYSSRVDEAGFLR